MMNVGIILALLLAIIAASAGLCAGGASIYSTGYMLFKGERLKAKVVDMELCQASRGQNCHAVVEFMREGRAVRMTTTPVSNYAGLTAERRMQRSLRRWKEREVTVLYARPFRKREAQVCILRWMWKEIFWETVMIAIMALTACAIADRI